MEKKLKKGRPKKTDGTAKRAHFSVWTSPQQKNEINEQIVKSGLSASEYFLTLALDIPFKRPRKRTLSPAVADTVRVLQQLAGILSLAVLKTKDRQMVSKEWQQSSQQVRLLSSLITRWVFEDFEIRSFQMTLSNLQIWTGQTMIYLKEILETGESKEIILKSGNRMSKELRELLEKYETYYSEPLREFSQGSSMKPQRIESIHQEIADSLKSIREQIREPKN
jgi:hypothetical protein